MNKGLQQMRKTIAYMRERIKMAETHVPFATLKTA